MLACSIVVLTGVMGAFHFSKAKAAVGINEQINYQGRLLTNTGAVVPDGNYNVEFKIYQDGNGVLGGGDETLKWTETRTGGNKVLVKNGYFSIYMGSVTPFGSSVDWNQDTLWLSVNIGGTGTPSWDGEMSPFTRFSSTPYALNSKSLEGLTSANFVRLAQGVQADSSTTNPSIFINKTGATANILQLQKNGSDVFAVNNSGLVTASSGSLFTGGSNIIRPSANSASGFSVQDPSGNTIMSINTGGEANIITNSTFESGTTGWTRLQGAETTFAADNTAASRDGAQNLRITTVGGTANQGGRYIYQFTPNTTYTFSVWAAASAGFSTFDVGTNVNGVTTTCLSGQSLTTLMQEFSCSFTTGATTTVNDYVFVRDSSSTSRTLYFDSASLVVANTGISSLISNPSFENGNTSGWALKSGTTPVGNSISDSTEQSNFGDYSLKIVTGTSAAAGNGAEYRYAFQPNTQYSLSFWAKRDVSSSTAFAVGRADNGTDSNCTTTPDITSVGITTTWTQFSCTFTTGGTIGNASNFYIKQTDTGTSDNIYVDGVTLVSAPSGLSFVESANAIQVDNTNGTVTINGNNSGELQPWKLNNIPLGASTPQDTTQVVNREGAASARSNGYIYSVGGYDGTNTTNGVFYAKMNADGSVGAWQCQGTAVATSCGTSASPVNSNSIPGARRLAAATVANGYLYVVGGFDGTNAQSTVYYAKLNSDGTTGTWQTNVMALTTARVAPSVVVNNGVIYVLGGCSDNTATCGTPINTVYYGKLNADGSIMGITTTNAWNTNVNNLTNARGMGSAVLANGYIYYVGGRNATAQNTVYYAAINSDFSLGTFSSGTQLPQLRQEHATAVANGYMYIIGGFDGTSRANTVFYSRLNADGTISNWNTGQNFLPSARQASSFVVANSYIYLIGGFDGTNRVPTVYYASTPRTLIAGGLDLVGLTGQTLGEFGGGGTLTAGNTRIIGDLSVDGHADFNNGISVDSAINLNAVSAALGQTVFNINNLNSNSIFNIRHMSTNFGSLVTGGAFMGKNSYWAEEFNTGHNTNCTTPSTAGNGVNSYARGDTGGNAGSGTGCTAAGANIGAGSINLSHVLGAAAGSCQGASQNLANGVERLRATATVTAGSATNCVENLAATTTTSNKIYSAANLPVMAMKVRPTTIAAANNNARIYVGMSAQNTANTAGSGMPGNGIFFSNCSTYSQTAPTGCSNTTWYGFVASGNAIVGTAQACTGAMSSAQFAYLRIEVRSARTAGAGTSDVHFYADVDSSNGINEVECGTGIVDATTNLSTAMTPWVQAVFATNTANTTVIDIDYLRSWQDDNLPGGGQLPDEPPAVTSTGEPQPDPLSEAPLTPATGGDTNINSIINFDAATSVDTVFDNDVYVKGTLYADRIRANQIEGLEIFTNQLSSLQAKLDAERANGNEEPPPGSTNTTNVAVTNVTNTVDLSSVTIQNGSVVFDFKVNGGLTVGGPSEFRGNSLFAGLVTFVEKTVFNKDVQFQGRATFNADSGGYAVIKPGQREVEIRFDAAYQQTPVVSVAVKNGQFVQYAYTDLTAAGFKIVLPEVATQQIEFSWVALSVNNAKTSQGP